MSTDVVFQWFWWTRSPYFKDKGLMRAWLFWTFEKALFISLNRVKKWCFFWRIVFLASINFTTICTTYINFCQTLNRLLGYALLIICYALVCTAIIRLSRLWERYNLLKFIHRYNRGIVGTMFSCCGCSLYFVHNVAEAEAIRNV